MICSVWNFSFWGLGVCFGFRASDFGFHPCPFHGFWPCGIIVDNFGMPHRSSTGYPQAVLVGGAFFGARNCRWFCRLHFRKNVFAFSVPFCFDWLRMCEYTLPPVVADAGTHGGWTSQIVSRMTQRGYRPQPGLRLTLTGFVPCASAVKKSFCTITVWIVSGTRCSARAFGVFLAVIFITFIILFPRAEVTTDGSG